MSPTQPEAMAGIAQAAEWRLLGLLFERPHGNWHSEVAALAREIRDPDLRAVAAAAGEATEGNYLALLGPGGTVSPREVSCHAFEDPGKVLADLRGFYDAFGFLPQAEDPIDHIAVETEFVSYLLLKEQFGRARGDGAAVEVTVAARQQFLERHLGPLARMCFEHLDSGGTGYLTRAARLLAGRVPAPSRSEAGQQAVSPCSGCSAGSSQ